MKNSGRLAHYISAISVIIHEYFTLSITIKMNWSAYDSSSNLAQTEHLLLLIQLGGLQGGSCHGGNNCTPNLVEKVENNKEGPRFLHQKEC